eukprot:28574-Eustigmatos_ZCMA.PRE.1
MVVRTISIRVRLDTCTPCSSHLNARAQVACIHQRTLRDGIVRVQHHTMADVCIAASLDESDRLGLTHHKAKNTSLTSIRS